MVRGSADWDVFEYYNQFITQHAAHFKMLVLFCLNCFFYSTKWLDINYIFESSSLTLAVDRRDRFVCQ